MQYINSLSEYKDDRESAVTFGKFDGLHRGHRLLAEKVRRLGERDGIRSIVCAFDMGPFFRHVGKIPQVLMTGQERRGYLEGKVDVLAECPFTQQFSQIQAEDFIRNIIKGVFHAKYVVVGTDFQFGYEKRGDIRMLGAYAEEYGYQLIVIEKERYEDRIISSTYIKEVLRHGDMRLAGVLLGYAYGITGRVEHGNQLGRTLGFPTLNVPWPENKLVPPKGVYLANVRIDGRLFHGISNVGVKPTVSKEEKILAESYLFGYDGDAYGKSVTIELLEFCRPEQRFDSLDELKACIDRDISYGKHFFACEE